MKGFTRSYGKELSQILGIPNIVDATIHFPLDGTISADIKFILTDDQAKKLLGSSQTVDDVKAELRKVLERVNG